MAINQNRPVAASQVSEWNFPVNGKHVRIVDEKGDPWFVAKDVCDAAGVDWNGKSTLADLKNHQYDSIVLVNADGKPRKTYVVSESGMFRLVMRGRSQSAVDFQEWVCEVVLPSIRRHGYYDARQRLAPLLGHRPLTRIERGTPFATMIQFYRNCHGSPPNEHVETINLVDAELLGVLQGLNPKLAGGRRKYLHHALLSISREPGSACGRDELLKVLTIRETLAMQAARAFNNDYAVKGRLIWNTYRELIAERFQEQLGAQPRLFLQSDAAFKAAEILENN